jgi:chemotaxis protein methyltransferase CheR
VIDLLPPAVRESGRDFRRCAGCGHVYWDGSHTRWIRGRLAAVRSALDAATHAAPDGGRAAAEAVDAERTPDLALDDHRGWARFDDFFRELLSRLDLSWRGYRRPRRSLRSRLVARIGELGLRSYAEYLDHLAIHPEEEARLDELLAVTISRFFRDREDWLHLAAHAFPALAASAGEARATEVRAVSVGCASGEEPYTLRLLWDQPVPLAILAVDVRVELLARAKEALYSPSSVHSVPEEILNRHFTREGGSYRLDPTIITAVRFARLDVWHDSLPGSFDLILCRNLAFTYLGERRRHEIARRLVSSLAPGGFLMIGGSERLPEGIGLVRAGRSLYRHPDES